MNDLDEKLFRIAQKWPRIETIKKCTTDDAFEWRDDFEDPASVVAVGMAMGISNLLNDSRARNASGVDDVINEIIIPLLKGEGDYY